MSEVFDYLKSNTHEMHIKLEKVSFAHEIMSKILTLEQYEILLLKNLRIYSNLEPRINKALQKLDSTQLDKFRSNRLKDLRKDLTYHFNQIPQVVQIDNFDVDLENLSSLLGVLYVMEGARLGGTTVAKALLNEKVVDEIKSTHFYSQPNINIGQRWKSFKTMVEQSLNNESNLVIAQRAANDTFHFFYKIFLKDA